MRESISRFNEDHESSQTSRYVDSDESAAEVEYIDYSEALENAMHIIRQNAESMESTGANEMQLARETNTTAININGNENNGVPFVGDGSDMLQQAEGVRRVRTRSDLKNFKATNCRLTTIDYQYWYQADCIITLDLSLNLIEEIPKSLPLFLSGLECLKISGNRLCSLPETLSSWKKMTKMILGSSSGGNPLNVLPTSISKMESLKHLEVAGCELTQIQPGTFGCSLEFLNLERNQIVQFDANVFTSECSNLKTLILSSNCIVELCESLPLSVPNLKALHIDNNSIHKLPNTIVIWKEMQELTLGSYVGGNPIVTLPSSIQKLKSLVCLKAINCQIECLKPDTFCPSLERLDLNRNKITHIEPNSFNSALKFIDLSFNEIKHLGPNTFTSSLKFLVLNDNQLKCIESSVFDSLPSMLKALNLSNNAIKEIPEDLPMSLPSLKYLDIDQNNIKALPKTLGTWKKMKELILGSEDGGNPIGTIPTTIREMESLRDLNLRSCEISHLEPNTFGPSIETLDLSYNRLQELKADPFAECHNLKFMCFRENSIDYISEGFIKRIEELSKLQLDFIGLCNNKICAFPLELLSVSTVEFSIEGNPSVRPEDGWETETSEHRYQETAEGILHRSIPNTETYSKLFELSEDKTLQKLNVYTSGDDPVDTYLRIIYLAKEDPQQKTPLTLKNFGRRVTSLSEIAFKVLPIEKIQPDFPLHLQETMRQKKKCFVCKKGFFNEWLVFIHWESYASNLVLSKARVCSYECHSKCLQFLERYPFELENYVENSDDSSTEYEEVDSDMVDSEFEYEDELW